MPLGITPITGGWSLAHGGFGHGVPCRGWMGSLGISAWGGLVLMPLLRVPPPSLQQGKSSSTGNLLDKDDIAIPPPDYSMASQAFPAQGVNTFKQRPYSVAVPAFSQVSLRGSGGFSHFREGFL